LVHSSPAYRNDWGGGGLPDGVYWWVLQPADGSPALVGELTILR
jgi:hypothetical protein